MPFSCKKPACLEQVLIHTLTYSNIDQANVRTLDPEIENRHCERCDEVTRYHIVPVKFGGTE